MTNKFENPIVVQLRNIEDKLDQVLAILNAAGGELKTAIPNIPLLPSSLSTKPEKVRISPAIASISVSDGLPLVGDNRTVLAWPSEVSVVHKISSDTCPMVSSEDYEKEKTIYKRIDSISEKLKANVIDRDKAISKLKDIWTSTSTSQKSCSNDITEVPNNISMSDYAIYDKYTASSIVDMQLCIKKASSKIVKCKTREAYDWLLDNFLSKAQRNNLTSSVLIGNGFMALDTKLINTFRKRGLLKPNPNGIGYIHTNKCNFLLKICVDK